MPLGLRENERRASDGKMGLDRSVRTDAGGLSVSVGDALRYDIEL